MKSKSFGSDNHSGIHPQVLAALESANQGDCRSYGDDPYTEKAIDMFKTLLGDNIDVYPVFNGTGANVLGIKSLTRPYHSVIAATSAHLQVDECGAPENFTGCKIKLIHTNDGKLTPELINQVLVGRGDQHHVQPKVVSIAQVTELGTAYTAEEIRMIADFIHQRDMLLHMDGSRIANAAAYLNCSLKEITADCGVDVLSFGGTKNGMMLGEAVVFFNKKTSSAREFMYIRKQGMQLFSKMRFLSAQYLAYFSEDLWFKNASHANAMAAKLYEAVKDFKNLQVCYAVQSNALFIKLPKKYIRPLQQHYFFYIWDDSDPKTSIVRWMTSFDTREQDVDGFVNVIKEVMTS